jgi:hypothetical protein
MYEALLFDGSGKRVISARGQTIAEAVHNGYIEELRAVLQPGDLAPLAAQAPQETLHDFAFATPDDPNTLIHEPPQDASLLILWAYNRMNVPVGLVRRSYPNPEDLWQQDPDFPMADWAYQCGNFDTVLGYWAWVDHERAIRREHGQVDD